jgi:phosphate transport system protein
MPDSHRRQFREELARLENHALGALDLVRTTLRRTLEALTERDIELAAIVVAHDDWIDGRYLEVHQGLLSLLALQAPVASDLRVVAALLHVINHAERMGDQCVNIAKLLPITGYDPPTDDEILLRIERMGALAGSEVAQAQQAFRRRDVALARDLVRQDAELSRLNREIVARALERIGGNAVDIGEQVAFVVSGTFREATALPRICGGP